MSVKMRQKVEREIATEIVRAALAAGYDVLVSNGEEAIRGNTEPGILGLMFKTDQETLYLYRPGAERYTGWVDLVYGNDGHDVIHDYSTNIETLLEAANKLADSYA